MGKGKIPAFPEELIFAIIKKWYKDQFLERWHKVEEEKRKSILAVLVTSINFGCNAFLLAIPFQILLFFLAENGKLLIVPSFKTYILITLSLAILLPFFEHYFIWIKSKWKDDID